ncbi:MAG: PleD family two-component system response regulator [Actinomycetota bacterium]|nr:response regulator [Actinomycetota bacterium]
MEPTVLIVDDEPDVRTLCKVNLEYEGYRVIEAADGLEALEVVKTDKPDVILLDLMMPNLDGWEVLKRLQADPETGKIPVLLLTAKADQESQLHGWEAGIVEYVTKPFNPVTLPRYIKKALEQTNSDDSTRRADQIKEELKFRKELKRTEEGGNGA